MKVFRKLKWALPLALVMVLAIVIVVLAATVTIDNFEQTTQVASHLIDGTETFPETYCSFAVTGTNEALGDHRDLCLTIESGDILATGSSIINAVYDYLDQSLPTSIRAKTSVQWDGADATSAIDPIGLQTAGVGIDLTDGNLNDGIAITVIGSDGVEVDITLRIWTDDLNWGEQTITFASQVQATEKVVLFMPFDNFVDQLGDMDETDVGAVEFEIDSTNNAGGDMTVAFLEATNARDYGDLPDSSIVGYPDYSAIQGASHISQGLRLGVNVDSETQPNPSAFATGDNVDNTPNDEDGIQRRSTDFFVPGNSFRLLATINGCTGTCRLNGWIDWNGDGDFADPDEQLWDDLAVVNVTDTLLPPKVVPTTAGYTTGDDIYARFRICPASGACDTVDATDVLNGEVEDHFWEFGPSAVTLSNIEARNNTPIIIAAALTLLVILSGGAVLAYKRYRA